MTLHAPVCSYTSTVLHTFAGALIALAAGVFAMRETAKLIARQIEKRLGRPSLVRETSRRSGWQVRLGCHTFFVALSEFSFVVTNLS